MIWGAAAGVIKAGGQIASTIINGQAKRKALNKQIDALKNMQRIDPERLAEIAKQGDIDAWKTRLDTMRQVDPNLSKIREDSIKSFTLSMAKNAADENRSDDIAKAVFGLAQQFAQGAPAEIALGDAFINKAKEKLDRGAQLPPTYQAELIRSGLEQGGAAGIGANRKGPVAGVLGRLLGSAAMGVERQNEQDAINLAGAGTQIAANRMNILRGLIPQFQQYEQGKLNLGAAGLNLVNSETPSKVGFAGAEKANLEEAKRKENNAIAASIAGLEGNKALANAEMVGGVVKQATDISGALLGGLGGGGGGGLLGGLTGGGGQQLSLPGGGTQQIGYSGQVGVTPGGYQVFRSPMAQFNYDLASSQWQ